MCLFLFEETMSLCAAVFFSFVVGGAFPKEENVLIAYNRFVLVTTLSLLSVSSLGLEHCVSLRVG